MDDDPADWIIPIQPGQEGGTYTTNNNGIFENSSNPPACSLQQIGIYAGLATFKTKCHLLWCRTRSCRSAPWLIAASTIELG